LIITLAFSKLTFGKRARRADIRERSDNLLSQHGSTIMSPVLAYSILKEFFTFLWLKIGSIMKILKLEEIPEKK
jgi:hypothetical protein